MAFPRPFGRYVLEMRIAMGGMAEIFRARVDQEGFQKRVCIKCVLPHFLENESFVTMFRDEAALAAKLQHANIVQVFDFGEHEGSLFLAMEFIDGADLKRLMTMAHQNRQPLTVGQCLQIGIEVSRGLHFAHSLEENGQLLGIVHRDVSPHNILISRQGEVKVTDFGIAKASARATHTAAGVVKGKLAYMAPEQAEGAELDHRADQFALGVVLWELLTGERLFGGGSEAEILRKVLLQEVPSPKTIKPEIDDAVAEVVMITLNRDRDQRFKDLRALERALTRVQFSVADDPSECDLRAPVQALLDLSVPTPRQTAVLQAAAAPPKAESLLKEESEVLSLTEAGFDRVESSGDGSAVFAAADPKVRIEVTNAAESGAATMMIDGSSGNKPLPMVIHDATGVTRTVVPPEMRDGVQEGEPELAATILEMPIPQSSPLPGSFDEAEETERVRPTVGAPVQARANRVPLIAAASAIVVLLLAIAIGVGLKKRDVEEKVPVLAIIPDEVETPAVVVEPPVEPEVEPVALEPEEVSKRPRKTRKPKAETVERDDTSKKSKGKVYVDVIGSWASVYAGGRKRCDTPCSFELTAGSHKLKLSTPDGDRLETVTVTAGKETRVIVR